MFKAVRAPNGVVYFASDKLPGAVHGFSTRIGGASENEHTAALNLAFGRGDARETVLQNVCLFADAVGFCADALVSVPQIHSDRVIRVTKEMRGAGVFKSADIECDGYIVTEKGSFCAVKTADCVPVLLYDSEKNICAAVHAGWRGTFSLIARRAVEKMAELGSVPSNLRAAIGPAINGECYEVGEEVALAASAALGEKAESICVKKRERGKYLCDLKAANELILLDAGLSEENIDVSSLCTHCEKELFYSHRASGGKRGTMMSVIGIK